MLNKVLLSAILLLASISGASNAVASTPLSSHLESIKETFVPSGEAKLFCRVTAQDIHENIPGSKYVLMKNCGHFPYVEDPATYFKYINEFLSTNGENAF